MSDQNIKLLLLRYLSAPYSTARHELGWGPDRSGPTAMLHRLPSTGGASGDKTGATGPGTDWHCDGTLRAAFPPLDSAPVTARVAVHPVGADENWADRYGLNRPGQRHRAGHPWRPTWCGGHESERAVWGSSQRRGSLARSTLRQSHPVALRWPRRPAVGVPPTKPIARWRAEPSCSHHGLPLVHPPRDGRGRARRPDAAVNPNQFPHTNCMKWPAHLVREASGLAR